MGLATFKGGVHPYEGKELSENKPVQVLMPKGDLVFPMSQGIGAPANPLVKKGDRVLAGQIIGEAGGFISANVICSVSGTVKAVEPRRVASGGMVNSVVVENDGQYEAVEGMGADRDPATLSKQEIRDIVKAAGIVGMGGAGFPTNVKLSPKNEDAIEYILIKKLKELVKDEPRIEVCELLTKYPQGGERSLIYAVTGRSVNSSMLPADAGCIVDNIGTVIAIYDAVCKTTPLIERVFTVTGDAIADPRNFRIKIGTNTQELIEAAGGFKSEP